MSAKRSPAEAAPELGPCCPCPSSAHGNDGRGVPGDRCSLPGCPCPGYRPREKRRGPSRYTARVQELARQGLDTSVISQRLGVSWATVQHARTGLPRKARPNEYAARRAREQRARRRRLARKARRS